MWFGSYNGLHKHEGTSIKVYNKSGSDVTSLSSKEMHAVFEDRLGYIWAGTTGGLDKLDPGTGVIEHYKLQPNNTDDDRIGYIISIFQDDVDNIWVATNAAMFIIDYHSGHYRQVPTNDKTGKGILNDQLLYKGTVKTKAGIWMFARGYIMFYDFATRQFIHQYNNPQHKKIFIINEGLHSVAQSELCVDSSKNLYFIFNHSTLIKYNMETEKLDSFNFTFPKDAWRCCYSLATDHKGNVWIGFRYGGLMLFNNADHEFTPIRYQDANSSIQSDYVYSLCEDYLKRMWVTTNNGIFIINYYDSIIKQQYLSDRKEFININFPAALISQDNKGNIFAPFHTGGLFIYNIFNGTNRYFPVSDSSSSGYGYVYNDEKGSMYIGNNYTLRAADTALHHLNLRPPEERPYQLLMHTPSRVAWVFKHKEASVYFKKADGHIYYYNGTDSLEKIGGNGFAKQACVSQDHRSLFFLLENDNLVKRNLATLKMDTILLLPKLRALQFTYTNTRDIADDQMGNIWITSQNGLIKYNLATENISIYTTANGLLHDFSFTLCSDSKKRLWVGSMGGVNVYDPAKNTFLNVFPESPDKLSNYFGSSLEAKDGHIYFLFGGKLVNINPDGFFKQKIAERLLHLNEVQVNGNSVNYISEGLPVLSYKQNRLYFRFGLLEFSEPEKVKYFYLLEGNDKRWIDLGNRPEVTFNSLQPGKYVLKVKATDVYGNTVKRELSIPFTISPPFWKTWWFIALVAVLLSYIIYLFIAWREKNIKTIEAEKLKLQQLSAAQLKSKLKLEQIINYFSSSLIDKNNTEDVLWDVAKNLIGRLGFVDCMIYLWNEDKTKMLQKAGYGPKNSVEDIKDRVFEVAPGQGVVGYVITHKEPVLIGNTMIDKRYRPDDLVRLSEITVPLIYNNELIGVIDSEHPEKHFYTQEHVQLLTTIATLVCTKIKSIEAERSLQQTRLEMYSMNEQLSKAKLEALRSQMNPHFIFNSLNAIQECILTNKVDAAYEYLSKFSKLQRMVLNNSEKELIPLSREIEMLQLYLSLESLRFSKSFSYTIDIPSMIDIDEVIIPSLITQPIVENAIWHGLRNRDGEKILKITYEEKNGHIFITIEDNGIGREQAAIIKQQKIGSSQYASKATIMLSQRLLVLSQQLQADIRVHTTDKKDAAGNAAGTIVVLSFPSNLEGR